MKLNVGQIFEFKKRTYLRKHIDPPVDALDSL
jgi:hypothetical protein